MSLDTSHFIAVLELLSQSSNFARITILRNGVFSTMFSKYVLLDCNKLYPPINFFRTRRTYLLNIGGKKVKKRHFAK